MLNVILAKSSKEAAAAVCDSGKAWVAIETEYGNNTIDTSYNGVEVALNHHGDLQDMEAPALAYTKKIKKRYDNFLISHIDLDVLFGILWTAGWLKETKLTIGLSNLVAMADINGFHTIKPLLNEMPDSVVDRYYAIGYLVNSWVINDHGQTVKNISKEVHKLLLRIKDIILNGATNDQIIQYKQWFAKQEKAAKAHLREIRSLCNGENLFVFRAPFSLTTAYDVGDVQASVIVQYNEQSKSISLGCYDRQIAERYFGKNGVLEPLIKYFGRDAGGKYTVGGTSRSHDVQPEMLSGFIDFLYREYFNIPEIIDLSKDFEIRNRVVTIDHDYILPGFKSKEVSEILKGLIPST